MAVQGDRDVSDYIVMLAITYVTIGFFLGVAMLTVAREPPPCSLWLALVVVIATWPYLLWRAFLCRR
jgi:hypothetical protein